MMFDTDTNDIFNGLSTIIEEEATPAAATLSTQIVLDKRQLSLKRIHAPPPLSQKIRYHFLSSSSKMFILILINFEHLIDLFSH